MNAFSDGRDKRELEVKYDPAPGEEILVMVEFRAGIKLGLSAPKLADLGAKSQVRKRCFNIYAAAELKSASRIAGV